MTRFVGNIISFKKIETILRLKLCVVLRTQTNVCVNIYNQTNLKK